MAEIRITGALAERLQAIAAREGRSVEAVLQAWVEADALVQADDWAAAFLARVEAEEQDWGEQATDLSLRSREILEKEFADHLRKEIEDSDTSSG